MAAARELEGAQADPRVSLFAVFGKTRALVIERFDRRWTKDGRLLRVPQEDCCQALSTPPGRKYQNEGGPGMTDILKLSYFHPRLRRAAVALWKSELRRRFRDRNHRFWSMMRASNTEEAARRSASPSFDAAT